MKAYRVLAFFVLASCTAASFPALANDNCGDIKAEVSARFTSGVCHFGICTHATPADADVTAAVMGLLLPADGTIKNMEAGHRTIKQWWETNILGKRMTGDLPNTYLSYACGNK